MWFRRQPANIKRKLFGHSCSCVIRQTAKATNLIANGCFLFRPDGFLRLGGKATRYWQQDEAKQKDQRKDRCVNMFFRLNHETRYYVSAATKNAPLLIDAE